MISFNAYDTDHQRIGRFYLSQKSRQPFLILIMLQRLITRCAFSNVKILISTTNNIHFNLATEEYLF